MNFVGFGALHTRRLCDHAEDLRHYLHAMLTPTWLRQPQYLTLHQNQEVRRPGRVRKEELREVVAGLLAHPTVSRVALRAAAKDVAEDAQIVVETRPIPPLYGTSFGSHWIPPTEPARVDPWAREIVDYFDAVGVTHAAVFVMNGDGALIEGSFVGITRNGVSLHPFPDQFERMQWVSERERGTTYVRYPRWGTLYSHDQVAKLGGAAAIEAAVQPAVIRELSGGIYFQITDSVATAATDEALEKQRAFWRIAEPLLPPR